MPSSLEQVSRHRILGFDRDQQMVDGARAMGLQWTNEQFQFRCDFMPLQIALCVNRGGIAVTHESIAQTHGLVNVCPDIKLPDLPVNLVCHRDVQHNRAIRVMMDYLASNLSS